ncbi:MAG TPA: DUF1203 domain-containing protein [Allosphingosinicella sp.]|jgi:hypothetical protein|uniref:DUF1203 domain-containing protein n=1 Tax=Allosphingosinicella sp. TaxID=2823234 RepID=UPI002F2760BA
MAYRIVGLAREEFEPLFGLRDDELAERNARRVRAEGGAPCRISLKEADAGESLLLVNYVSHDVPTPFRTAYAIYVREAAGEPPCYRDEVPAMLDRRMLGLRGFNAEGMLKGALLAMPGEADARIWELLEQPEIASIHAHNAAHGCFLARVERD